MKQKAKIKTGNPSPWKSARRWAAFGTLLAYTTVGDHLVSVAFARDERNEASEESPQERLAIPVRRYEIPGGSLESVASAFQSATGVQVTFERDAIRSLPSNGISGTLSAEQALQKMLAGSGATYRFTGALAVNIILEQQRSSIDVVDSSPMISNPKYTEPLRDVPQTIMVIPKAIIEQQAATTLRDVLRNVPGLTVAAGEGGTPAGDNLTLRGFSARNDIFVDGSRDLGAQSRDPFNMEQVEVTKGPTSGVSGRGSAGGTINMVSKAPNLGHNLSGTANFGSDSTRRASIDFNTPLKAIGLGERTAFRFNGLAHHSDVNGRNAVYNNRWGLAPSIMFGLGTSDRLTLGYYKLKQDNLSDYGIPWVPVTNNVLVDYRDKPAPVPRDTFYGYRDRDKEYLNSDLVTGRYEHDFSDTLTFRNQFRWGQSVRNSMATPPRFASNDSTVINREMRSWIATDQIYDNQTDIRARFKTGSIEHAVVSGANFTHENNIRVNRTAPNSPTTLFNPNPDDVYNGTITTSPYVGDVTGNTQAVYLFDTARFGRHWEATGGVRWERFAVDGITTAPAPISRTDSFPGVRAGLVYKPVERGSIYASYGTSFNPSLEGLSYAVANTAIPPEKTYTVEAGTKWEVLSGQRLMLTGALFQVDKDNARTPGILPDDPPQVLDGRQRVKGVELSATGAITRDLKILGAYTFMDSRIARSNTPAEVGMYFQNTPRHSSSIWVTYAYKRLLFGGGPRFMSRRYGNNINTRWVDGYWTLDAMASMPINRHFDLRVNLYNLNNAYYFDRLGGGHVVPGFARTINGSVAFRF